ncbi:SNARE associated Golgi protein [Anaerobiospirillum thomasii]|uniref:SNARE associated Golgi protein n=1 Tax=Anaerobiospirillum thomasii TaxID=179995 RepID=A0A2X0VH82_9GAMM|nr:YqaA family protein [Anaerobiospirillum thomasii]SPT68848.1 SNARE associated Golgi protein [Anaerobiospirillum thomasii]SPT71074.1 SNARE associated Golgi protein [Anaerobiospirillum thomasii]
MNIFSYLYEVCIKLAKHPKAVWFLSINTFIESIFWPIPPDVMLAPMCLAKPNRAFSLATVTVVSSVLGAVCGYYLGYFIYDPYIADIIQWLNYQDSMDTVRNWFTKEYGILMIFVGAFTPIPYKVIAVTSGVVAAESVASTSSAGMLTILNFVLVSFVGRGARFFLVAGIIKFGGERMEHALRRYIDIIGWICVVLITVYIIYEMFAK